VPYPQINGTFFILICLNLVKQNESLPYQEHGITKHQLAVFPETAEQEVVSQVNNFTGAHILYAKQ
jgi:hypothetical protein